MELIAGQTTLYGRHIKPCPKCSSKKLRQMEDASQHGEIWCADCGHNEGWAWKQYLQAIKWNEHCAALDAAKKARG